MAVLEIAVFRHRTAAEAAAWNKEHLGHTNAYQFPTPNRAIEATGMGLYEFRSFGPRTPPVQLLARGSRDIYSFNFRLRRSYREGETEPTKEQMVRWLEPIVAEAVAAVAPKRRAGDEPDP
jgi:hypothetical protein